MEFSFSDFPISKDMFDTNSDVEADSRHGVLAGDACIATGDSVPPSESDDPNLLSPNFPCQITACQQSFASMDDLEKHRTDSHELADFTISRPSGCYNNDELKSQDQSSVNNEHVTQMSACEPEQESSNENSVKENSDDPLTVHWNDEGKDGPAAYPKLAKLLISEKIRNRRPTPYWPDQLQSMRAAKEASELETHKIHGRIEGSGHANQWRNALLLSGTLILVNKLLQKLSIKYYAFCSRCTVSTDLRSAASHAALRTYHHVWHEGSLDAIRGISGGSLLRQFLQTSERVLPYTPATPEARWVYGIAAAAVFVFVVWKIRFRSNTPWRTLLYVPVQWWPRRSAGPRRHRHRLNRTGNANDHDPGRNGAGSGGV